MERKLYYTMAFTGGFLGAYAILNRCDIFGNAQTANMIYIVMNIAGRNVFDVICRLGGLLIYMSGIAFTVLWPKFSKVSLHYIAVAVDMAVIIMLGFMPEHMNNIIALYPIFLAASIQWNSFTGISGYNCSTIFSTNNLRQFTIAATEYMHSRERRYAHKAGFYGGLLVFYHLGVAFSYLSYKEFGIKCVWAGLVPVIIAAVMMVYEDFYKVCNLKRTFRKHVEEVSSNV